MDKKIEVCSSLLDDIFRLVDYLADLSDYDDKNIHTPGYTPRFVHDTALWELKLRIKRLQTETVNAYLLTIDNITEDEMDALEEWVWRRGMSVYDNPYLVHDGFGRIMDFINGCRIASETDAVSSYVHFAGEADDINYNDEDLPF